MKNPILTIVSCAFIFASCSSQKVVSKSSTDTKTNQYTNGHLKTGFWIEKDTITAAEIGIKNPDIDHPAFNSKVDRTKIASENAYHPPIKRSEIIWGNPSPHVITAKGVYNHDKKFGKWEFFIADTIIVKREFYTDNTIDSIFFYSKNGKLILEGHTDWNNDIFFYNKYGYNASSGSFPIYFLSSNKNWNWVFE
jgi:hypothetical protein